MFRDQPSTVAWNVTSDRLHAAEGAAAAFSFVTEGTVFLLAKGATEADAMYHFALASAAHRKLDPKLQHPLPDMHSIMVTFGLSPFIRWFEKSSHPIALQARFRLKRLLDADDCATPETTSSGAASFLMAFLTSNPLWTQVDDSCELVFWRFPSIMLALILRVQQSGLCFIHAPLTTLHYLRNMLATSLIADTIDITSFMRRDIEDGGTAAYVFSDTGGSAKSVLLQVLQPSVGACEATLISRSYNFSSSASDIGPDLRRLLKLYGPGCVLSMAAEKALKAPRMSFTGKHTTDLVGLHSVVLVGVRRDARSGKHFMLLQNSWANLPFFEVDEDYWYASKAEVNFVVTPQTAARPGFITNSLDIAESGVVGAGVVE